MENFMVKYGKRLRELIGMGVALPLSMSLAVCTWLPTPSPTAANRTSAALFSTLVKGNTSIAEIKKPALFLAADAEKAAHFAAWINDNASAVKIAEVDFDRHLVVAIFAGARSSSGYGIAIQRVERSERGMTVTVSLSEPLPGQVVADVVSIPYHVITVPHEAVINTPNTVWRVVTTNGEEMITIMAP
jgi:hypothetical protein